MIDQLAGAISASLRSSGAELEKEGSDVARQRLFPQSSAEKLTSFRLGSVEAREPLLVRRARLLLKPHRLQAQEVVEERRGGILSRLLLLLLGSVGDGDYVAIELSLGVGRVGRGHGDRRVPRGSERGLPPAAEASACCIEEGRRGGFGRGKAHFV